MNIQCSAFGHERKAVLILISLGQMGTSHFVDTTTPDWHKALEQSLDLIVSTSDCDEGFPLKEYCSTLKPLGRFLT